MSEGVEIPQAAEAEPKPFPATNIPDKSCITSQISINSQKINVDYSELGDYFDWIKGQEEKRQGEVLITQGAKLTANNLHPGELKWDEIVASGQDEEYTLGRSIKESTNTCFQRAVFFNLLMQQAGVLTQTLEGMWVESVRSNLRDTPAITMSMKPDSQGGLFHIGETDKSEGHLWNIVEIDAKHYLVDTAYFVEKDGKQQPVIQEIEYKPGDKYFTMPLPTGETRHYVADGAVRVESLPK